MSQSLEESEHTQSIPNLASMKTGGLISLTASAPITDSDSSYEGEQANCLNSSFEGWETTLTDADSSLELRQVSPTETDSSFEAGEPIVSNSDTSFEDSEIEYNSSDDALSECTSVDSDISITSESDNELSISSPEGMQNSASMCVLSYILRYNISRDASSELMKLFSVLKIDSVNSSDIDFASNSSEYEVFHYCSDCSKVFPNDPDIYICGSTKCENLRYQGNLLAQLKSVRQPRTSFISANIETQIKSLLERKGMWKNITDMKQAAFSYTGENICDIIHGSAYQAMTREGKFLHGETNISCIFNTDGVPLYSSSNVKLWPIFLAINELPPMHRFSRDNLILAGIWQGKKNPPFREYLGAFSSKINHLFENGIAVCVDHQKITVKVTVCCGTMDLQAKAYVLNMSMHNGKHGCSTCEEEGKVVKKGKGHCRVYPYKNENNRPDIRKDEDIKQSIAPRATPSQRIKGICGESGISNMLCFDLVDGMLPDYMHGVLMGAVKNLLYLWLSPTNSKQPWFIGNKVKEISEKLCNIQPPDYIERLPRDLEKHYSNFKATELQSWLLFYGVPCIYGIIPERYLQHFCLLSGSIFNLLGDKITPEELASTEAMLDKFYKQMAELYNEGGCGLNIHNIGSHLVYFVKRWGPLWAWSCFAFEDANAAILKAVHGTGDVTKQYLHFKNQQFKMNSFDISSVANPEARKFIERMRQHKRQWGGTREMENCSVAGKLQKLNESDMDQLKQLNFEVDFHKWQKVLCVEVMGEKFYSAEYQRLRKRICCVILTSKGEVLRIKYFFLDSLLKHVFALCEKFIAVENDSFLLKHILKVNETNQNIVIPVNEIVEKLFYLSFPHGIYVARLPNLLGHSVLK